MASTLPPVLMVWIGEYTVMLGLGLHLTVYLLLLTQVLTSTCPLWVIISMGSYEILDQWATIYHLVLGTGAVAVRTVWTLEVGKFVCTGTLDVMGIVWACLSNPCDSLLQM